MGYCTHYAITTVNACDQREDINAAIAKLYDGFFALNGFCDEPVKWYRHEDDMKALSRQFPHAVFRVHGEGEDGGDLWDKYFQNGKMQVCPAVISYAPFDPAKLQ